MCFSKLAAMPTPSKMGAFGNSPHCFRNVYQAFCKDGYGKINKHSHFKCSLSSCIKKLRDTAAELGSKYTFFKTWNSLLSNNGSLNYSLIS